MKAIMPMMMPMKQAKRERIMRARVASKWAVDKDQMSIVVTGGATASQQRLMI